jgi:hypothetical protein
LTLKKQEALDIRVTLIKCTIEEVQCLMKQAWIESTRLLMKETENKKAQEKLIQLDRLTLWRALEINLSHLSVSEISISRRLRTIRLLEIGFSGSKRIQLNLLLL